MPSIKGVDYTNGITLRYASPSSNITLDAATWITPTTTTVSQAELFANQYLKARMPYGDQIQVHVYSISPLRYVTIVANPGVTIPPNWWPA